MKGNLKKMAGYEEFQRFKNFEFMDDESIDLASNYVCLQLNNPSFGYKYYYDMYSYITKCKIVLQKYNKTRLGQAICEGELVDFLKDPKHKNCSCGSVFFDAVF